MKTSIGIISAAALAAAPAQAKRYAPNNSVKELSRQAEAYDAENIDRSCTFKNIILPIPEAITQVIGITSADRQQITLPTELGPFTFDLEVISNPNQWDKEAFKRQLEKAAKCSE